MLVNEQKSNLEAKKLHSWGFFCFILGFVCFFWIFHSFHTVATSPSVQYKLISKLLYSYIIKMNSVVNTHTRLQILIGAHPGKTTQMWAQQFTQLRNDLTTLKFRTSTSICIRVFECVQLFTPSLIPKYLNTWSLVQYFYRTINKWNLRVRIHQKKLCIC